MKIFKYLAIVLMAFVFAGCSDSQNNPDLNNPDLKRTKAFSVSKHKKILFSNGNLQYHPLNNEWRFAESQLERMKEVPEDSLSATYDGWIDLFCWGTGNCPTKVSTDIFSPDTAFVNFVDWGINQIGNDKPNTWRTLTNEEWNYLTDGKEGRKNADSLCSVAQIDGMNGFILLPDNWTCPSDVSFKRGVAVGHSEEDYAEHQIITLENWLVLEESGAIFLPVTEDNMYSYGNENSEGYYWSSTLKGKYSPHVYAYYFEFDASYAGCGMFNSTSKRGFVRLVQDVK